MRPERRFERRNGKGGCEAAAAPKHTDSDPSEVNLLRAKIGLDKGVHFRLCFLCQNTQPQLSIVFGEAPLFRVQMPEHVGV